MISSVPTVIYGICKLLCLITMCDMRSDTVCDVSSQYWYYSKQATFNLNQTRGQNVIIHVA
jgi:hypothetical protein